MKKLLNKLVAGLIVALVALAICAVLSVIITLSGMLVVGGIDYLFKCELPLKKITVITGIAVMAVLYIPVLIRTVRSTVRARSVPQSVASGRVPAGKPE